MLSKFSKQIANNSNCGINFRSIFRTVVHSEPCHIEISGVFRIGSYSELCQTATMQHFARIVNGYNYFRNISFSRSLLYEKNVNFYNAGLLFTPESYKIKKLWDPRGPGVVNF